MRKDVLKKVVASSVLCSLFACYTVPSMAYVNEETIYSNLNSNGEAYKVIASTVQEDENGTDVDKKDIEKDLPIDCKVTYKLEGEEKPLDEIIGKKGKVTIELKYTNKDEKQVWVNGQNEKMYTPFLVVSGMILDNNENKNIEINHGKIINNGEKTIVAGFAVPGLVESLQLEDSDIDVCDTIEISLETESFELSNIMTFATPKVFDSLDISMNDFSELFDKVNELQNASNQIEEGATSLNNGIILLNDGVTTLKNGSQTLSSGVDSLKQGAENLNNGATALKDGINEYAEQYQKFDQAVVQVSDGASQLNSSYGTLDSGISSLSENSVDLKNGAEQVSSGTAALADGLNQLSSSVSGIGSNVSELENGAKGVSSGIDNIVDIVEEQKNTLENGEIPQTILDNIALIAQLQSTNEALESQLDSVDESVQIILNNQIDLNNQSIAKLQASNEYIQNIGTQTKENINTLYKGLTQIQDAASQVADGTQSLSNGMELLSSGTSTLAGQTTQLVAGAEQVSSGAGALSDGAASLKDGSKQVAQGIDTLSYGTASLSTASSQLTTAAGTISSGAGNLQAGTTSLLNGANTLATGTGTLVDGINSLSEGSQKLVDGSGTLLDGIKKFNTEGIDNICNLVNNDGKNLIRRIEKLEELSKEYTTFASEEKRDNIQFISIMDSMSKADAKNNKKE